MKEFSQAERQPENALRIPLPDLASRALVLGLVFLEQQQSRFNV